MKKTILAIFLAGLWITASEFIRNELLFKSFWVNHFNSLGLKFETLPINGILWMVWSFLFAYFILKLLEVFSFGKTFWLSWLAAFVMMWITIYNLQVLPMGILIAAIPLSILEITVAELIINKFNK